MDEVALQAWLVERIGSVLDREVEPALDTPLEELGLSSRDALTLAGELEELLDRSVPPTVAWEAPTIRLLAAHLADVDGDAVVHAVVPPVGVPTPAAPVTPAVATSTRSAAPLRSAAPTRSAAPADAPTTPSAGHPVLEPVAVVGVGCRFPGATGPEAFWDLLREGRDAIGELPAGRWEAVGLEDARGSVTTRGGFLDDVEGFDAEYFGVSPREAALVDPQQRLLLEVTVEALHHAHITPASLRGSATGVFVGVSASEYAHLTASELSAVEPWTATGAATSITANRVSYALDLHGPSLAVDTACSSSLVALHQAAASLRAGESSLALVGGVNLLLTPLVTASFDRAGALAADGRCKSFGAGADGIGRAEGCGVVVLERLSDALAAGHRVLAVVTGSAVNSDGRSNGLTAPNPSAQEAVLHQAWERADVDPTTVDYVEAHGTGTALGDPIEAGALGRVLGAGRATDRPLLLGSVKSNLGHLEAAAGVAGVIKVALALHHDTLPPTLHGAPRSPHVDFAASHLDLVDTARPWPRHGGIARAGVSGFGFGGTNAHVVLEQAPPVVTDRDEARRAAAPVLAVSGRTSARAVASARALADWLDGPHGRLAELDAVAATLAARGPDGRHRVAVPASDHTSAANALRAAAPVPAAKDARPVWVFAGYGQQWPGMARDLMADDAVFAAAVAEVAVAFEEHTDLDVADLLASGAEPVGVEATMLTLFAVQIGLAAVWESYDAAPVAVLGHSMGEVAAAVVAGGLTLGDGAHVMAARSRLLAGIDTGGRGAMAVLDWPATGVEAGAAAWPDVEIAVYSSPGTCTVAGPTAQVETLIAHVEGLGHDVWPLKVTGAGHSAAVDPVLAELGHRLDGIAGHRPELGWYGTVADDPRAVPAFDAAYWIANARRPVRFAQAVGAAIEDGHRVFVEISAHPVASHAVRATAAAAETPVVTVGSLRRDVPDAVALATNVAALHAAGHPDVLVAHQPGVTPADVPAPPWQHTPHWFRRGERPTVATPVATVDLGAPVRLGADAATVWTHDDLASLLGPGPFDVVAVAGLTVAAARAAGVTDPSVTSATVEAPVPTDGRGLVSCTPSGGGHLVEVFAASASGWHRVAHAAVGGARPVAAAVATTPPVAAVSAVVVAAPVAVVVEPLSAATVVTDAAADWAALVRAATPAAATAVALDRLRTVLGDVTGIDPDDLDADAPLVDLGVDSLMATRARHAVERDFGVPLPVRVLLQGGSLTALAEHVASAVRVGGDAAPAAAPAVVTAAVVTAAVAARAAGTSSVPPRDPTERFLVGLWREVLETSSIGVTEPLAVHGADGVTASRVAEAVRQRVGHSPSIQELLAAATVEAMADLVREDFEGIRAGAVTVLREGHTRSPLFLFHPAGGPCSVYRPLVDGLDADLPVYGMERLDDVDSVEARAEAYVGLIRARQPHGPYRLMGWSLGGVLAGECAHLLTAAGERVELLASIDTTLPVLDPEADPRAELVERYRRFAVYVSETYGVEMVLPDDIADRDEPGQLLALHAALTGAGVKLPDGVLRHQYTSYVDARIAERYTPRAWPGAMVLYRATDVEALTAELDPRYGRTDETLGWDATVADLRIVRVPGNHITMIDRPHVDVLARDLSDRLAAFDGRPVTRPDLVEVSR